MMPDGGCRLKRLALQALTKLTLVGVPPLRIPTMEGRFRHCQPIKLGIPERA